MSNSSDVVRTTTTAVDQVQHMKWWGWGVEGVAFRHDDKPELAPFVKQAIGLDVTAEPTQPVEFADLDVPDSILPAKVRDQLVAAVGDDAVVTDDLSRVVHTYGKSLRDLLRLRAGDLPRVPDVVVFPGDEEQVQKVVDLAIATDAVLIPFGGGSNISGSLQPEEGESRPIISLDMGRMNHVLDIDEGSGLATIQAGAQGPDLEEQLNARGWTVGHYPDSFTHSTLGGWVATRSSGMQSDKYGDISDICRGVRVVQPGGVMVARPLPSTSTGPSIREMVLGSEGRLGVITEVTVNVHKIPANREVQAYLFPDFESGLRAMHDIAESDASPSITRVSDAGETAFSFATRKESAGVSKYVTKALMTYLKQRGWDLNNLCLSFIGYEGTSGHVARNKALCGRMVKEHGGVSIGKGPGTLYDQKKFDTPYIRDFLLDRGAAADVSETAAPWAHLADLYHGACQAARDAYAQIGTEGWVMAHLSHSYHSGACLYFTFAFKHGDDAIAEYDIVKKAIQSSFLDHQGTLSHHHAVGTEHAPWMEQDVSPKGVALLRGLFEAADPKRNFNPGKIVHEDCPTVVDARPEAGRRP